MLKLKNENGAALALALMVMLVISILGTALWHYAITETRQVNISDKSKQAHYLARTGALAAVHAWLQEGVASKPEGELERVYYNQNTEDFELGEPPESGGYFEVTIEEVEDEDSDRYGLTEIISTGVVDGYSQTVELVTYPYTYGHDFTPAWYDVESGVIEGGIYDDIHPDPENDERMAEVVVVSAESDFSLDNETDIEVVYNAEVISFENPLTIDLGDGGDLDQRIDDPISKEFIVEAETVFFNELNLTHAPEGEWGSYYSPERKGQLILEVPDEFEGFTKNGEKYGRVFFDGEVKKYEYEWDREWFILPIPTYYIKKEGSSPITDNHNNDLEGNAYYFRCGTDLLDIEEGDLKPYPDEIKRPIMKDKQPYYWD